MISKSGVSRSFCKASNPLGAKANSYSPFRICRLKYWVSNTSKSSSSSTLNIFTAISIVIYEFQPFVLTFMMAKIESDRPGYNFIF